MRAVMAVLFTLVLGVTLAPLHNRALGQSSVVVEPEDKAGNHVVLLECTTSAGEKVLYQYRSSTAIPPAVPLQCRVAPSDCHAHRCDEVVHGASPYSGHGH